MCERSVEVDDRALILADAEARFVLAAARCADVLCDQVASRFNGSERFEVVDGHAAAFAAARAVSLAMSLPRCGSS